jgi:hypothetical protein
LVAWLILCASSVTFFIGDGFGGVGVFSTQELCFGSAFFVSAVELELDGHLGIDKCGQLTLPLGELSIQLSLVSLFSLGLLSPSGD